MRLGIVDHVGWAVAVTASGDRQVVDRRRIELVEPGVAAAPIHHESQRLDVAGTSALVADEALDGPRATLGPPWTKDHRVALAATIVAG